MDALTPEVLQALISDAVMAVRDERLWDEALEEETADRERLAEVVHSMGGGDGDE